MGLINRFDLGQSVRIIRNISDFPIQDENTITLDSACYYIAEPIAITKPFIIPDGALVEFTATCFTPNFLNFPELPDSPQVFFSGRPRFLFFQNMFVNGSTGAGDFNLTNTLFDLDVSSSGRSTLLVDNVAFTAWQDLGEIRGFTSNFIFNHDFSAYGAGLKFRDCEQTIISDGRENNGLSGVSSNDSLFKLVSGTFRDITIRDNLISPLTGESFLFIDPSITIDTGTVQNNGFSKGDGGTFLGAGSVGVDDLDWTFLQNGEAAGSVTAGEMVMIGNTNDTVISIIDTPVIIVGTTSPAFLERFTHINQRITYVGRKDITASVSVNIRVKINANNEGETYTFYIFKNGIQQTLIQDSDELGTALNNPSARFSLEGTVKLVTNDFIEIFVETNSAGLEDIKIVSFDAHVEQIE